jgi:hypothetical protein
MTVFKFDPLKFLLKVNQTCWILSLVLGLIFDRFDFLSKTCGKLDEYVLVNGIEDIIN